MTENKEEKVGEDLEKIKDFSDFGIGAGPFDGDWTDMDSVLGKKLILENFTVGTSPKYGGDHCIMQLKLVDENRLVQLGTSSKVLLDQIRKVDGRLPVKGRIVQPEGKRYYTFTDWEEKEGSPHLPKKESKND